MTSVPLPLAGIRVVDFSRVLVGPHCAKTLLDLGAEVIKVEPPAGDLSRRAFPHGGGVSVVFFLPPPPPPFPLTRGCRWSRSTVGR